jgi:hypothetical protein
LVARLGAGIKPAVPLPSFERARIADCPRNRADVNVISKYQPAFFCAIRIAPSR